MNYTLQQLKDRVNTLIEQQGPEAYCAAWIYTAEDCVIYDENDEPQYPAHADKELSEKIFNDVGNIDYIYTCLLYTSPSPRDQRGSRMPSSA